MLIYDVVNYVFKRLDLCPDNHITIDPKYFRPEELTDLKGDSSKLREKLSWKPRYTFESLLEEMIDHGI